MGYYMFLDDERMPSQVTWTWLPRDRSFSIVRNYKEFVDHITMYGVPEFVTFDHDLADEHYEVMLKEVEASRHTAFVDDDQGGLNITFDYGKEMTGFDCAKWLVDHCAKYEVPFPDYTVHSMNPIGRARIEQYIVNAKKHLNI